MSIVSWLIPLSHFVVVPLQVALRHGLLPYEVRPGPSLPTMSARVSIDTCAWSTSAILRPRMASTRRPGFPRKRGRPPSRQARLCWKVGSASPTHVPATIACFRDIFQQIVLPTRGRPPPYESSSSDLPQRTNLFFRSLTLALQCVPGTGRTALTSAECSVPHEAAVNKAGIAVPKAGRPAVKRAVCRKTNPVNAVSSDDDSTSELSSSSSCYIDFSFTRVAEEANIVYSGLQKTSGDTRRCLHSMVDLGNPHMLTGA
jgi:hypothetical protein